MEKKQQKSSKKLFSGNLKKDADVLKNETQDYFERFILTLLLKSHLIFVFMYCPKPSCQFPLKKNQRIVLTSQDSMNMQNFLPLFFVKFDA